MATHNKWCKKMIFKRIKKPKTLTENCSKTTPIYNQLSWTEYHRDMNPLQIGTTGGVPELRGWLLICQHTPENLKAISKQTCIAHSNLHVHLSCLACFMECWTTKMTALNCFQNCYA